MGPSLHLRGLHPRPSGSVPDSSTFGRVSCIWLQQCSIGCVFCVSCLCFPLSKELHTAAVRDCMVRGAFFHHSLVCLLCLAMVRSTIVFGPCCSRCISLLG